MHSVFCSFVVVVVVVFMMWVIVSPLDSTNNIFSVTVDVGAPEVTCQFLNGPVTSATCTIQYGTDPTYVNLPNTDSSSGIKVINVTVPLSTPLLGWHFLLLCCVFHGSTNAGNFSHKVNVTVIDWLVTNIVTQHPYKPKHRHCSILVKIVETAREGIKINFTRFNWTHNL